MELIGGHNNAVMGDLRSIGLFYGIYHKKFQLHYGAIQRRYKQFHMVVNSKHMLRALEISRRALPKCRPNPPVGCVLVRDDEIVSEGYTQEIGGNHAEVEAISFYDGSLDDVTLYVTLEPCSFHGRTPPCADMLIKRGVKNVVVSILDPDPRNSGKGIEKLKEAGVSVHVGLCSNLVENFLVPYLGQS